MQNSTNRSSAPHRLIVTAALCLFLLVVGLVLWNAAPGKTLSAWQAGLPTAQTESFATTAFLIHLNTATAAELQQLPGVGETLAQRILLYRRQHDRFTSVEQLSEITGISTRMVESWRAHLTL